MTSQEKSHEIGPSLSEPDPTNTIGDLFVSSEFSGFGVTAVASPEKSKTLSTGKQLVVDPAISKSEAATSIPMLAEIQSSNLQAVHSQKIRLKEG